jgi:hypothetical protein
MQKERTVWLVAVAVIAAASLAALTFAQVPAGSAIQFPAGYRNWTHVKSMVIHDKSHPLFDAFGGIHHVYVNERGVQALHQENPHYPDGSIFVFDLLEARLDGGAYVEGDRKVLAVMVKDSRKYAATGGWGFEAFAGGDPTQRVVKDAATECFQCHASQQASDYVFSKWRP